MSAPVEAQSLSALTNLFANPPQYPRNPTHRVHEPLVLYIVRVPGSKDVFLSPLKPPIQSSLYYLHVNTPEDEDLKRSLDQERRSEELSRPQFPVARKPLPSSPLAKHPLPPTPEESQQYQPYKPLAVPPSGLQHQNNSYGSPDRGRDLKLDTRIATGIHRKPISPTAPPTIHNATGDYALSPSIHENQAIRPTRKLVPTYAQTNSRGASPAPSRESAEPVSQHALQDDSVTNGISSPELARRLDSTFLPVTIIRRDPASGSQWNIGTITLLQPTFTGSSIRPVSVELNTPGYGRFARDAGLETPRPGSARSDATSIKQAIQSATISLMSTITPDAPVTSFSRIVDFRRMAMSDLRRTVYQRTNSSDSIGKIDPTKPGLEKNVLAFESPWHGTCTFVNAIDGTSLKIKHTINSNSSAAESTTANVGELRFNLGWSLLSSIKDSDRRRRQPEPDTLPVSELLKSKKENFRQSLQSLKNRTRESYHRTRSSNDSDDVLGDLSNVRTPTTNNLADSQYPQTRMSGVDSQCKQSSDYPRSTFSAQPTASEDNDEEARLSLRLGREKAGGGFRGHSAKLGKLIIEDEGLKMCDLVVGAAMGVWWQHYGG